jgi:hypothetical protein
LKGVGQFPAPIDPAELPVIRMKRGKHRTKTLEELALRELEATGVLSARANEEEVKRDINFRARVLSRCGSACVLTGCTVLKFIDAAHIEPFRSTDDEGKLDERNGLILESGLHRLWDCGFADITPVNAVAAEKFAKEHCEPVDEPITFPGGGGAGRGPDGSHGVQFELTLIENAELPAAECEWIRARLAHGGVFIVNDPRTVWCLLRRQRRQKKERGH